MAKVRLFYRRKICYWLIVSVMILMTLNPSLQVIAKESVSDDLTVYTDAGESLELYARSAVLMDGDSGRILFEKNGSDPRPMASTTKIMTCILALEASDPSRKITVSSQAASQPKVHLGMTEGQSFYLKDLLYSLMLESHNDAAVAIAEGIDGSVEAFAQRMNQKAEEIGTALKICFSFPKKYIFHFSQWIGCTGFSKQSSYYSPGTCTDPALLHYDFAPA